MLISVFTIITKAKSSFSFSNNFLRVNVFYEELNLQKIVQTTPYVVSNVLSFACDQVIFVSGNVQNLTVIFITEVCKNIFERLHLSFKCMHYTISICFFEFAKITKCGSDRAPISFSESVILLAASSKG